MLAFEKLQAWKWLQENIPPDIIGGVSWTKRDVLTAAIVSSATVLTVVWLKRSLRHRGKKLPPRLPALPVVGSLPFLGITGYDDEALVRYQELAAEYGNVYSFWLASRLVVVLSGHDVIRAALVDQSLRMAGRPFAGRNQPYFSKLTNPKTLGLLEPSVTPEWQEDRNLSLAILNDFEFGRNIMEFRIQEEIGHLVTHIRGFKGRSRDVRHTIHASVTNVLCAILLGTRFSFDDCVLVEVIKAMDAVTKLRDKLLAADSFPLLRYLPPYRKYAQQLRQSTAIFLGFLKSYIAEHEAKHFIGKEDDFLDAFIGRMGEDYQAERLLYVVRDLFIAGTESTAVALQWAIVYMVNNQDVQKVIQLELDTEVGKRRQVSMHDKIRLPYTEAVLQEIQRIASITPISFPHMTLGNVDLCGYFIPKDTMVFINLWSVLRDPMLWPDPDVFLPERFLDEHFHVIHRSELIPYSLGSRSCLGELMAGQEFFLFFCGLMQNFSFRAPDGVAQLDEIGTANLVRRPLPFEVIAEPRWQNH